jgi:hypothetical protein
MVSNFIDDIPFTNKYCLFDRLFNNNKNSLKLSTLVWIVGEPIKNPYDISINFYESGYIALVNAGFSANEQKELEELSSESYTKIINSESILAFESYPNSECLEYYNVCVSLKSLNTNTILEFISERLEELYSNDSFYYDDNTNNNIDSFYELVVDPYARTIMGNCIKSDFTIWDLKQSVSEGDFAKIVITNIQYQYDPKGELISVMITYTDSLEDHLNNTARYKIKTRKIYK